VTLFVDQAGSLRRQRASQVAGFAAVTIAAAALIGWWAGLPMLSSWGAGLPPMKPVAAVCLLALGLALMPPGKDLRFAVGLAIVAVATLDLFRVDFGINDWLVPRGAVPGPGVASFRMINGMPLALWLAGGSLALSRFEGHHFAATALGGLAGVLAVFALLTYLTGIDPLYDSISPLYESIRPPALPTIVGLLCVAGGIILRIGTMPELRKPRPLWHLQIVLGCAIIAPLLLFGTYAGLSIAGAQVRRALNDLRSEARTLSAAVDREIIGEVERLHALAASPSLRQGDLAAFQHQAEASLTLRPSGNIMLIDRDMRQVVNTSVPFGTPMQKAAIPEPAERAFATGKPQVTGLFMGPVTHQLMFGIVVPVEIDGENRYALVRSLDQRTLERLVAADELSAGWHAVVAGRRTPHHRAIRPGGCGHREGAAAGAAAPGRTRRHFRICRLRRRPSLEAYARSELTGWEIAVWEPKALLEAPVRALWWALGVTALLAITLVVALALGLGRIIARSVGHTARAAIALGEGRPMPLDQTPVAEVNTLMAQLRRAATRRKTAEDSGSGRFLRANAAMCKFVGYSEAELLARSVYDITYPDDLELDHELCRRLDAGDSDFDVEKRYVRKDGEAVWARTTVNVIRDAFGRPLRHMAVIQDLNARKRAEEELKSSKDRLQLALNAAQLGSWQYDPRHHVFSGDARAQEIFDFTENEAAIEEVMKRVHPDDVEKVLAAIEASLDPVDPKRSATEFRLLRADGEIRWVETLGLAYFEGAGPERRAVSFGGTIQDITERKEREEKEHLLMREINHRAKNMLSVVDAIAHQTATRNPEDFVERFSERIQALSANQDLLVRNEWNGVEIEDLVCAQLALFADLIGFRIAVHGPKLRLKPAAAQAIGLALHELATNAGKYGALSTDTGRVDVRWGTGGDIFSMSWTERDGPPVSVPTRRGFGTIVMEAMAERSVDGRVDLDYAPSGVTWRLTCPAANALEPSEREQNSGERENRSDGATGRVKVRTTA
jgi:PAS domain S-box-containing protein